LAQERGSGDDTSDHKSEESKEEKAFELVHGESEENGAGLILNLN